MTELRDKALLALDEAFAAAERRPIPKTAQLRLTLAFLSNFSDDREPFDSFWKYATNPALSDADAHEFGRMQILRNAYLRVYRAVGVEPKG